MLSKSSARLGLIGILSSQIMFEEPRRKHTGDHLTCRHKDSVLPLSNLAHQPSPLLHVRGAMTAQRFIAAQPCLDGRPLFEALGEYQRVFKREATTLSEIGSARVSSITEQRNPPIAPASQWAKVIRAILQNGGLI